jgi:hypothetical protein
MMPPRAVWKIRPVRVVLYLGYRRCATELTTALASSPSSWPVHPRPKIEEKHVASIFGKLGLAPSEASAGRRPSACRWQTGRHDDADA